MKTLTSQTYQHVSGPTGELNCLLLLIRNDLLMNIGNKPFFKKSELSVLAFCSHDVSAIRGTSDYFSNHLSDVRVRINSASLKSGTILKQAATQT